MCNHFLGWSKNFNQFHHIFTYSKFTERCPREMACKSVEPSRPLFNWQGVAFLLQTYQILISFFQRHSLPGCYYRDSDFCFLDDNTGKSNQFFLSYTCLTSCRGGLLWSHSCAGAVYRLFRQRRSPCVAIYIWRKLLWLVRTQSHEWKGSSGSFVSRYHDRNSSWWRSWFRPTLSWKTCLL